jgi:hypothetical protein
MRFGTRADATATDPPISAAVRKASIVTLAHPA